MTLTLENPKGELTWCRTIWVISKFGVKGSSLHVVLIPSMEPLTHKIIICASKLL